MSFKIGKFLANALIIGLLVAILYMLTQDTRATFVSAPINAVAGPVAAQGPIRESGLRASVECIPGPSKNAAYYTVGLNAEGLCGDGDWVNAQMRDYRIDDGIGGSLLEK